ncbi:hypothetical protein BBK82_06435 [Lentzea guizhouensis]|uniref:Uncharacterized protein n=1 Tax=Lentzea guizhouensis TaxID=1586287 RepID=A0A1B2HDH3_9PSEU|nr:hypothetical protein [Lentzea guizhouensis]ANZ35775.1 hypothetical protein BBK82_06435 [Lentzea guizhouensis]
MIERPDNSCAYLSSAVNAKVAQLARWTWRHPRVVNLEVNRQIAFGPVDAPPRTSSGRRCGTWKAGCARP